MEYFAKNLDKLIAIFALAIAVAAPEKVKKWGVIFILIAIFIFIVGFFSENKSKRQKKWGVLLFFMAIIITVLAFFSDNVSDTDIYSTVGEQDELEQSDDTHNDTDSEKSIQDQDELEQSDDTHNDTDSEREESHVCEDVSIRDETFESGVRGMASLYSDTSKMMPIWFEKDLDDVFFSFLVDNLGQSYAYIKHTKLIIDNYEPLSMKEALLLREEAHADAITEVGANVDLINITDDQSEYDVNFYVYNEQDDGEKEIKLREGRKFNVDQTSQMRFCLYPKFYKSGIYTYHLKVDYEYYKKEYSMETEPVTFIYMEGDSSDYHYDYTLLASLKIERKCHSEESGNEMYYTIEGRTLKIHNTKIVFYDNDFNDYFSLIDTIVIGEGTEEIEAMAFCNEPGLYNVTKAYLPKSLEYIDLDCFCYDSLEYIYYEGTEEQWYSLITNTEGNNLENIENVEIIFNYEY